jgi:thiol:disulfide interchange protein
MELALTEARDGGHPMLVYFYADWCPYCRELQNQVLDSEPVNAYFRGVVKVRINAEDGSDEESLARTYGAVKIPSLFILSTPNSSGQRISRWRDLPDGGYRLQTPEEFVETCRNTIGG